MTVYTIGSGKGGAGKTLFTVNAGTALAQLGLKTLIMDCDIGMANLNLVITLESRTEVSLHDVLAEKADVHEAINHTPYGVDVLPSGLSISGFKQADPEKLRDVMGQIVDEYDYILIDSPAGISKEAVVPLAVCDEAILIINPELTSITDALKTKLLTEIVGRKVKGVVINRAMGMKGELGASKIEELLEVGVLGIIPNDKSIVKAVALKVPVVIKEPDSPASKKIKEIVKKLTNTEASEEQKGDTKKEGFVKRLLKSMRAKS